MAAFATINLDNAFVHQDLKATTAKKVSQYFVEVFDKDSSVIRSFDNQSIDKLCLLSVVFNALALYYFKHGFNYLFKLLSKVLGRDVFAQDGSHYCMGSRDPHGNGCRGKLFCLPDPYGCSCAAGYKGLDCMQGECIKGATTTKI